MYLKEFIQLLIYVGAVLAITKPMGVYLFNILNVNGKTWLDKIIKPIERLTYKILGINPGGEQNWKQYGSAMLIFSTITFLFTYIVLRIQQYLPLNPQYFSNLSPDLAFNTAVSFATNTNLQGYTGESTMSYFSQMVALTTHNFWSAACGIAIAAALIRGITGNAQKTLGNFWVDITRITYYLLLPIAFIFAIILVSCGMIQNFDPYTVAKTIESQTQTIVQGPMASQVAIKLLGTNGGGFTNANASHPFENPTGFSNFLQMLVILSIPSGLTYYLGKMANSQKHGWSIWIIMFIVFFIGFLFVWHYEVVGNPIHQQLGITETAGNMEGKETRFGIFNSSLFATITTDTSTGAVNAMHDSFTPLGGLILLVNMQLGEVVFGGVGSGIYGIIVFVIFAVFIVGLMVGRTPEYLGQKIEIYDIKVCSLFILVAAFSILGFTAWASINNWGITSLNNNGPHGLTEIIYAFSSATGNNGSTFAGLVTNTTQYNILLGVAMLIGRYFMMIPIIALAGSFARKKIVPAGLGTFPLSGLIFIFLVVGIIILVGALTFLPALALGPVLEHYLMKAGKLF